MAVIRPVKYGANRMNIMSNGSFLDEMNASNKQEALVKSLTSAWEKKNSKVARAGGVSLMALTLAACGGSDDTPFSQVDVDSAVTAANAAAAAEAAAAATAAAASEAAAVAAAEATAAEAATAAATAAAASEAAAVAAAEATAAEAATAAATAAAASEAAAVAAAEATATAAAEAAAAADIAAANAAKTTAESAAATAATAQAAAETAQAAAETAQAAAETAQATAEAARDVALADKATAETAQAAAETAKVAAEAAKVAAENATAIAEAAKATAEASLATLQTTYDALLVSYNDLANPAAVDTTKTLTSLTDNFTTTNGNDTFYALTDGDFATGDILNGGTGTDNLVAVFATAAASEAIRPVMTGIETIDIDVTDGHSSATTTTLNLDQSTDVTSIRIGNNAFNTAADTFAVTNVGTAASLTVYDTAGHGSANANNYTMTYSGVSGTSDTATVNVEMSAADGALGTITIANVENVTANAIGGYDATYALTTADATTLTITAAADAATDATGGTVTATAVLAETLNVTSATDLTISDNTNKLIKVNDVNINSTVADEVVTITGLTTTATASTADAVTIDISGAGDAAVEVDTAFGTYDATTNADSVTVTGTGTGDVTVTMNTSAANIVTTGSGNDTLVIAAGEVLNDVDNINLGGGTGDTIAATASYASNAAIDLFHDDSVTTTDPTISGVEIARITLADSGAASTVATTSASFASTIELMGDLDDAGSTINNIGASQTIKLGSTLDMTHASSSLTLVQEGATASAPASSLTITSDLLETSTDANIDDLRANVVSSVSLDLASTDADVVTVTVDGASFDKASSVTVTSVENVTFGAIDAADDATLDFTGVTGTLSVSADTANNYTIKGSASGVNTIIMSTGLDSDDVITGGSATTDSLTATVNGLTATTGALSISGVETIELDTATAASTINASGIVGASTIAVGSDQDVTMTGLASGTAVQFGVTGSVDYNQTLALTMANATGSSDTLTVKLAESGADNAISADLDVSGVETITVENTEAAGTNGDKDLALDGADATTVIITGGKASEVLDLTAGGGGSSKTLNAATTTVDASAFDGVLTASAATNTATAFTAKTTVGTLTGGAVADTFTISSAGSELGASLGTINGGTGADTLTAYVKGSGDLTGVTNVETINLVATSTAADYSSSNATVTWAGGAVGSSPTGAQEATTVNISGGLVDNTVTLSGAIGDNGARTVDASSLAGSIIMEIDTDGLVQTNNSDAIVIRGGADDADVVTVGAAGVNTGAFTMSGVETLIIDSDTGANTVNLANVTGLSTIVAQDDNGTATAINIDGAASSGLTVQIGGASNDYAGVTIDVDLADATGSSDSITVDLKNTTTSSGATVDTTGIETVNVVATAGAGSSTVLAASIAGTVTAGTVNVSGTDADDEVTLEAVSAGYTTINATDLAGDLVVAASARGSDAMTITGGAGADTIAMENAADVLTGGAGTVSDELVVTFAGTGGATVIDLSSTSDQVQLFNGLANSAVQTGFEDIDLSSYTQTGSAGADVTGTTGANIVVGTTYSDTVRLGAGDDTYVLDDLTADTVDAGAGTSDALAMVVGVTVANTVDFGTYTNFEKLTANAASNTLYSFKAKSDFKSDTGIDTIDFSADTAATGDNVIDLGEIDATMTAIGGSGKDTISLSDEDFDMIVTGGAGNDVLISTAAANTDTFVFASTGALNGLDTITGVAGSGKDIFDVSAFLSGGSFNGTAVAVAGTADVAIDNKVVMLNGKTEGDIDEIAEIAALIEGSSDALSLASGGKGIVISGDASGDNDISNFFFVDDTVGATAGKIEADDVVKVATFSTFGKTSVDLDTLVAANFDFIA